MTDPYRTGGYDPAQPGLAEPSAIGRPNYADPAYAGQLPTYGAGYPPSSGPNPAGPPPQRHRPPTAGPDPGGGSGPPEPPRSPRWLWLLAGAAVLLVIGLVIALVLADGTAKKSNTLSPLPAMPNTQTPAQIPTSTSPIPAPSTRAPAPGTSTNPTTAPPPSESTDSGVAQTVIYSVRGEGRAISIAYIDTGGVLQTEFNVVLPWRKQVNLEPPASKSASVTVVNIGEQITCSVSVDGAQVRHRTGTILTICAGAG